MNLKNISGVQTGLVLVRKKAQNTDENKYIYSRLTLKSFEPQGWLNERELDVFLSKEKLENKYITKKGDIILRLTAPYTAICINDNQEGLVIPSNFAIIRLKEQKFIPEFISLFLNTEIIEKNFIKLAISTTIPLIKTTHIKDIDVPEKSYNIQRNLVELNQLYVKEKILLSKLVNEKERLVKASINKIIMEE